MILILLFEGTAYWEEWTEWYCPQSCGVTTESRNRTCNKENVPAGCEDDCVGPPEEELPCDAGCCPGKSI